MTLRPFLPYQAPIFAWAEPRDSIALFMQMRLGKSIIDIRWANKKARRRKLVVAPLSTLHNWQQELSLEGEQSIILHGSQEEKVDLLLGNESKCGWFLTNYESLYLHTRIRGDEGEPKKWKRAEPSLIAQLPWEVVTLDESAEARYPSTQKVQIINGYLRRAPHKSILCGLPNPEGPTDFFNQMFFLYGRFLNCRNWWEFRELVCQPSPYGFGWTPRFKMVPIVREAIQSRAYCLTRPEAGIGNKKIYESRTVILPQRIRAGYLKAETEMVLGDRETMYAMDVHQYCCQIAAGATTDGIYKHDAKNLELWRLLTGELKGESVVIWYQFNRALFATSQFLGKKKIEHTTVTGADSPAEASRRVQQFMSKKFPVILFQLKCGKYGRDLSIADTEIFMSPGSGYNERGQAEDRIEHPKKKDRPLLVLDLIAEDTVEEDAYLAMRDKKTTAASYTREMFKRMRARITRRSVK